MFFSAINIEITIFIIAMLQYS